MKHTGTLYVVATPIGNLEDITARALRILGEVDLIAAEDSRQSRKLLDRYGISKPLLAHHQHNQSKSSAKLIEKLIGGKSIALICDAGTPLISDPGTILVRNAHQNGIRVVPVPGASALSSALSVCGLEFNTVHFEGFLPSRHRARIERLEELVNLESALIFFEAPHRIVQSLEDMVEVLGAGRKACLAREMTKLHEQVRVNKLEQLCALVRENPQQLKGEFVVITEPMARSTHEIDANVERTLSILIEELTPRKAVEVTAKVFGLSRNALYKRSLELQAQNVSDSNDDTSEN